MSLVPVHILQLVHPARWGKITTKGTNFLLATTRGEHWFDEVLPHSFQRLPVILETED
jgi:hypothetical protein